MIVKEGMDFHTPLFFGLRPEAATAPNPALLPKTDDNPTPTTFEESVSRQGISVRSDAIYRISA